ncbi:MAG: DNA polymerase III subunit alpha [Firmicutes bacterium]|nr:DNA polymerase III subunit alpha [Bacillota bacterium]
MFTHLHVHTEYSLLDGICRLEDLLRRTAELGMTALAITDHGVMHGVVPFYRLAKKYGIKPIIGCEVYVAPEGRATRPGARPGTEAGAGPGSRSVSEPDPEPGLRYHHLTLLAEDETGYRNLLKLASKGFLEGFYYKPRVDKELLAEHSRGLIALSGCLSGEISRHLLSGRPEAAKQALREYAGIFGPENFFLELQDHGLFEERRINPALVSLGAESGIPLAATNDVHYCSRSDAPVHDLAVCIQTLKRIDESTPLRFANQEYYLKSPAEMADSLGYAPQALANTAVIAGRCNVDLGLGKVRLPHYSVPGGSTPESFLRELCHAGATRRYGPAGVTPKVTARLEHELEVITNKGFPGYFLIVWDIVKYARENNIPVGPGRGSAAGSLVSYLLGITDVDPLRYNLFFERFLNPERVDMPDIDIDLCQRRRDEVLAYVTRKYGEERVAMIGTFSTLGARAAIRDVGKALRVPYGLIDKIAKSFPSYGHRLGNGGIAQALATAPEFQGIPLLEEPVKTLLAAAQALEGMPRHMSIHAAGVLISQEPLTEVVPLQRAPKGGVITQYDMDAVEALGLLKIDLLGLRNLTIIQDTIDSIGEPADRGASSPVQESPTPVKEALAPDAETPAPYFPPDDPAAFALLQKADTLGCFQLESAGMRNVLKRLKPENLDDIIAVLSLYRPGPRESGALDAFIRRRHGAEPATCLHPALEPILADTYGVILYQEQVMRIAHQIGGLSLGEADLLRRVLGSRQAESEREKFRRRFAAGALKNGIPAPVAEQIFEMLGNFAGYSFNKAHSTAYGTVSYQTAFLKAHHPAHYLAALLSTQMGYYGMSVYVEEAKRHGVQLLPPDINRSQARFTVAEAEEAAGGPAIRVGLSLVKELGSGAVREILKTRLEHGPFMSLEDFCAAVPRTAIRRPALENLIKVGAFASLGESRRELLSGLDRALRATLPRRKKVPGQLELFEPTALAQPLASPGQNQAGRPADQTSAPEYLPAQIQAWEREILGISLGDHPLLPFRGVFNRIGAVSSKDLELLPDGSRVKIAGIVINARRQTTKKKEQMLFLLLEDMEGLFEVILFPRTYQQYATRLDYAGMLITGKLSLEEEEIKIIAQEITPLRELAP